MEKKSIKSAIEYNELKFTKRIVFKNEENTVFVLNFLPGQQLPSHKHPGAEVYILVLTGNGVFTIERETIPVKENDVILSTDDEELAFENNGSEPVSLYVMINKIPDDRYAKNI